MQPKRAKSIIQSDKQCLLCAIFSGISNQQNLEVHHAIHGTANRALSDRLGLWCWLCAEHHRTGKDAVHRDAEVDRGVKRIAQAHYELELGTREDFIRTFGKSYLL